MPACPQCGTDLAQALLSCPSCHWLVHQEPLTQLAQEAERATTEQRAADALAAWRQALELLPPGSRQFQTILEKAQILSRQVEASSSTRQTAARSSPKGFIAWLGFVGFTILAKGKLLLLGLGKASTLFSMLLAFGLYWTAWGWKFALGVIGMIYIHEMGHVATLQRYGIKATAPMFIPGVGAFVHIKQPFTTRHEDAVVGLAGPWWGLAAALAAYLTFALSLVPLWAALAHVGAWLTLFNLLPVWQLDGSRGFQALARPQRWLVALLILMLWLSIHEGLLVLLLLVAGWRALEPDAPPQSDRSILWQYASLLAMASLLSMIAAQPRSSSL